MRLYIKTCGNLETLLTEEQSTLCKKIVNPALWLQMEFLRGDTMEVMVKRDKEAFNRLQPVFSRKIKFLELADLDGIKSQDLKLMKYCQGLKQSDRLYDKLMKMEPKSWARA